jgi:glutamate synthase domain-containing protein 3
MLHVNAADYNQENLIKLLDNIHDDEIVVDGLCGQRYIACGWKNQKKLILYGVAGNNLAAFAEGPEIILYGNGQEGVGNTLSGGHIQVHGRVGDIAGYGMRGGELFIKEEAGYRLGIHMKAYAGQSPVIVVGGSAGAFTGEYMAGGTIIILGLNQNANLVGHYCGTGMYGGEIYLRGEFNEKNIAANIEIVKTSPKDLDNIIDYLQRFSIYFKYPLEKILEEPFTKLRVREARPFGHVYAGFVS